MVERISLTNFRSYTERTAEFHPNATIISGPNATGKTNLLESLYVLANAKSFRAKDTDLIRSDQTFYRIVAGVDGVEAAMGYQFENGRSQRKVTHDNNPRPLIRHLELLRVVLFEPNDSLIIYGSPDRRRRYLDYCLSQTTPHYSSLLSRYKRVLTQRNSLLSDWTGNESELFAWNVKLTELASEIYARRSELITYLNNHLPTSYAAIAGTSAPLRLNYVSTVSGDDDYATLFLQALESNLRRDLGAGFTTIGPHRDDMAIEFKGGAIQATASRGEVRTVILALKLAELAHIELATGITPLLLLDDVFSELDVSRRRLMIKTLGDRQTVITTTSADTLETGLLPDFAIIETTESAHA